MRAGGLRGKCWARYPSGTLLRTYKCTHVRPGRPLRRAKDADDTARGTSRRWSTVASTAVGNAFINPVRNPLTNPLRDPVRNAFRNAVTHPEKLVCCVDVGGCGRICVGFGERGTSLQNSKGTSVANCKGTSR